ncbi:MULTISPECIES: LysR family transcriptional regulator [Achromobacter]|uniref:LysR family transcriptional regulator n=1 Tax=Achromobacter spanius TaxID=217203 RepID=A0AA42LQ19_9BURK|nr:MULTISPECIES: LysR family transcriptional regulator [Achromobacter]MCS3507125.1 LysR family nitrogen assimilation transcriptional regulator [Achromobacter sp. JUb104]MDH0737400.1 LysR family transcriptional regulator [Achromobacter spanius]
MTPRQLRYFLEIARSGSLSLASAALRIAQPALSQHVAALEAELGVALFERHAKGVTLTAEGKRLQQRATSILEQLESLKTDVLAPTGKPRGPVRVCLARSLAQVLAAPLVRYVEQNYPDVRLLLSSALSSEVRLALQTRQLDVALMPNAFELPGLYCKPVYEEQFSLFGLESLFDRPGKTMAFSAIGSRPLVAPDRDHDLRRLIERTALDLDCPLNVKYEINDPELNFALVRDGVAFAILPDSAGLELARGNKAMGERRLVRPPIARMQSIVRVAEGAPDSTTLAMEHALEAVLRTLVARKVLRGKLA